MTPLERAGGTHGGGAERLLGGWMLKGERVVATGVNVGWHIHSVVMGVRKEPRGHLSNAIGAAFRFVISLGQPFHGCSLPPALPSPACVMDVYEALLLTFPWYLLALHSPTYLAPLANVNVP